MDSQYRQYFEDMPCYLTVQNRDFRIIDANKLFRKHFGDFEGRYCFQVYKRRSERCEVCPVARTFRDGERHESEEQVRTLDGDDLSVMVNTTPIRDDEGKITAVMEMSTDITHIKNLERLLRSSEQRHHLMFDQVPCYITLQDSDLNIVEANRAFQDDFGNGLGRKCYEAYKHRTEPCAPCPVEETLADGGSHTREELVTSRDGKHKNVLVTTVPIRNAHGELAGVMEMSADITEVRELEDRLTQLGLLIGTVSHGLKGMLNGLAGGMYLVDSGFAKENQERVTRGWATVHRNVARIRSMVSDILYYAKDREPNWEPVSAVDLANEVRGLAEAKANENGVQVDMVIDPDAGEFEADAQAIRSMLVNLIENSVDACRSDSREDHHVSLRLKSLPDHIQYEVEDNGIGMDQETREKAFSLFFSSKGTEGTGLGLFISDRIARSHGGFIELESTPGVGTRFVVNLPRVRPHDLAPEDPQPTSKEAIHG